MRALVTGGNGHLGFGLVQALRSRGHRVRASVRSLADADKLAPLRALGDVELVEADITDTSQVREAMDGVEVLFHAAAVYSTAETRREREILEAALRGTETVLRTAAAAAVQKVVLTSSVVTLPLTAPGAAPATEREWNADLRVPYMRAKTEGEQLAWRLAESLGLNLVTVLPGGIIGPGFQRNTPTIDLVEAAMRGLFRMGVPKGNFTFVDVRDVAEAHLRAAERDTQGRFIICDQQPSFRELVERLRAIDSRIARPLMETPRFLERFLPIYDAISHRLARTPRVATPDVMASVFGGRIWNVSSERAERELGWAPTISFDQSLRDTVQVIRGRPR